MESNPKFSVGESVILQSARYPVYNGEYTVLEIITAEEYMERYQGLLVEGDWYYVISETPFKLNRGRYTNAAAESSLRKKHQGSEFSFTELMSALNNPVQLPQQVES